MKSSRAQRCKGNQESTKSGKSNCSPIVEGSRPCWASAALGGYWWTFRKRLPFLGLGFRKITSITMCARNWRNENRKAGSRYHISQLRLNWVATGTVTWNSKEMWKKLQNWVMIGYGGVRDDWGLRRLSGGNGDPKVGRLERQELLWCKRTQSTFQHHIPTDLAMLYFPLNS